MGCGQRSGSWSPPSAVAPSTIRPPLTAVAPPKAEIGRAAAELLLHRLTGPAGTTGPVRRTELLRARKVRGSAQEVISRQELSV